MMVQISTGTRKRSICFLFFMLLLLGTVSSVFAVKVSNISDTPHNLSASQVVGNFWSDGSEICVFCHTPHNATVNAPLWNHYSTEKAFTVYSSATLTGGGVHTGTLPVDSISRLCLSCHEGTTALNALVNPGNGGVYPNMVSDISFDAFFGAGAKGIGVYLGDDLTSMHPIGFDYALAKAGDLEIRDIALPKADGLKFFGTSGNFLECSTCHDPHVDGDWSGSVESVGNSPGDTAYKKFLRMPNASSNLCLACHDK